MIFGGCEVALGLMNGRHQKALEAVFRVQGSGFRGLGF